MSDTFLTGDTHFGHADAISLFSRPFESIDAMDSTMIDRINERVGRKDMLIHIGDFCGPANWSDRAVRRRAEEIRDAIRCRSIVLIRGNHDPRDRGSFDRLFDEAHDLLEYRLKGGERERLVLTHYPLRIWRGIWTGAMHGYGHAHGTMPELGRSLDVGVDNWDFRPIEVEW
ncbi:MAG: metallophosphoesterase, partial [Phycisphaerae bacterium]|nr:metallophosphoesterase [Phycisphaerae bacterium]